MGKRVWPKSRTEKVSEWERENERIFINSTHSKQFDAFTALKDISFTVNKMSLFVY